MNKPKKYWLGLMAVISVHLVWDDAQLARAQHQLAKQVVQICKSQYGDDKGYFAGHWGWQYALEGSNWTSVEDDFKIPNNVCFSVSTVSWPQEIDNKCFEDTDKVPKFLQGVGLPIRVHSIEGLANYHSYMISNQPPIPTMTPFGWGYR